MLPSIESQNESQLLHAARQQAQPPRGPCLAKSRGGGGWVAEEEKGDGSCKGQELRVHDVRQGLLAVQRPDQAHAHALRRTSVRVLGVRHGLLRLWQLSGPLPEDPRGFPPQIVKQFRGGLVFQADRILYHSTLGLRVIKKTKKTSSSTTGVPRS